MGQASSLPTNEPTEFPCRVDVNIAARLAEAAQPDEVLISDRTLQALDAATLTTAKRRLRAKGTPADLVAHAVGLSVHE